MVRLAPPPRLRPGPRGLDTPEGPCSAPARPVIRPRHDTQRVCHRAAEFPARPVIRLRHDAARPCPCPAPARPDAVGDRPARGAWPRPLPGGPRPPCRGGAR